MTTNAEELKKHVNFLLRKPGCRNTTDAIVEAIGFYFDQYDRRISSLAQKDGELERRIFMVETKGVSE